MNGNFLGLETEIQTYKSPIKKTGLMNEDLEV